MMKKLLIAGITSLLLFAAVGVGSAASENARIVAIRGLTKVEGQDTVVEILVSVKPGEDARAAARAALRRAYPDAREINSSNYELTGLVWDVFSDSDPGNDQVDVRYNSKGVPGNFSEADYKNAFLSSQTTWTDVPSSKFVFHDAGETGKCPSLVRECRGRQKFDGNNDVGWLDIRDANVLGVTWYGLQTDEFDMVLDNADFTWHIGDPAGIPVSSIDVETVWLHEFGHGLGLDHSKVEEAVMFAYYSDVQRALHDDDIDGISSLYPSGDPTPTPTPEPTPTPQPGETVSVTSVVYNWYGGRNSDKHLDDTLTLKDENENPVAGVTVSIILTNDNSGSWNGTGTTASDGTVVFSLKNAPSGCYTTEVTSVSDPGWDGQTPPDNGSCTP